MEPESVQSLAVVSPEAIEAFLGEVGRARTVGIFAQERLDESDEQRFMKRINEELTRR